MPRRSRYAKDMTLTHKKTTHARVKKSKEQYLSSGRSPTKLVSSLSKKGKPNLI